MVYNDTTNKLGIIQECETLLGFDDGDISDDSTLLKIFTRLSNEALREINKAIWENSGSWQYDDSNHTDAPRVYTDLVDGQEDYKLDSALQTVTQVYVKDNDGDYRKLEPFDKMKLGIAWNEWKEEDGLPTHYDLEGRQIRLKPNPSSSDVTTTAGLRVHMTRTIHEFTSSDTDAEPGFDEDFHRLVAFLASYWYGVGNDYSASRLARLRNGSEKMFQSLARFYGGREEERKSKITPSHRYSVNKSI